MADSLKQQLVTANHILAEEGIIRTFGHVSLREPGTEEILIAGSRSPALVSEADIMRMDLDGTVLEEAAAEPYKETVIHRAIYRHRDDVNAVVHHHAHEVMPFTISETELKPAFQNAALFHEGVPTFSDYDDEFGKLVVAEDEGDRMAEVLGECRAQLLEGHGANVVGANVKEAIMATKFFVMNARYQYQAEQLESPAYYEGPQASIDSMNHDVTLSPIAVDRMWEYLSAKAAGKLD